MKFIKMPDSFCAFLMALILLLLWGAPACLHAEEEEDTTGLFSAWQEQASSATRSPKPLSQTAENITIITRAEIEALNAHTLADVLVTVPGIQNQFLGGAGSQSFLQIQSSSNFHILVMVDGIPLNSLAENFSDVGAVPARIIERIEIVKGAASSAWGQALGGVVNVITKAPEQRPVGGVVTASYGEGATADTSIELSGKVDRLGYYLSTGYLGFRDIPPHITTDSNHTYAKLTYDLPGQGQAWGTFSYSHVNRTNLYVPIDTPDGFDLKETQKTTYLYASLGVRRKLTDNLELEFSGRHSYRSPHTLDTNISDSAVWNGYPIIGTEKLYGASAKLVWRQSNNLAVLGGDFEHAELAATGTIDAVTTTVSRTVDRWGVFLNDTLTLGPLAITPGIRFDRPGVTSDQVSPSLGVTYQLNDKFLLRGYTARGYGLWALSATTVPAQKVWTSQVGLETTIIPYLWQKLTLFRNETWHIYNWGSGEFERNMAMGVEYEVRTTPVFNTSIGGGYTFTDTRLTSDDSQIKGVPRHTVQLSVRYDDSTFRGVLTGRHIFWNSSPEYFASYGGMIWDLHLGATLLKRQNNSLELFFSGHNLFDTAQTPAYFNPTPGRWFEGGVRVRF